MQRRQEEAKVANLARGEGGGLRTMWDRVYVSAERVNKIVPDVDWHWSGARLLYHHQIKVGL